MRGFSLFLLFLRDIYLILLCRRNSLKNSLVDEAVKKLSEGFLCSQAILAVYGKQYGISETTALSLARSFGAGMAHTCQTCGAVTGAYIVLGLRNDCKDEKVAKEKTYALGVIQGDRLFVPNWH